MGESNKSEPDEDIESTDKPETVPTRDKMTAAVDRLPLPYLD